MVFLESFLVGGSRFEITMRKVVTVVLPDGGEAKKDYARELCKRIFARRSQ